MASPELYPKQEPKEAEIAVSAWEKLTGPIADTLLGKYRQREWVFKAGLVALASFAGISLIENTVQDSLELTTKMFSNIDGDVERVVEETYDLVTESVMQNPEEWGMTDADIAQFKATLLQDPTLLKEQGITDPMITSLKNLTADKDIFDKFVESLVSTGTIQSTLTEQEKIDKAQEILLKGAGLPLPENFVDEIDKVFKADLEYFNPDTVTIPDNIKFGVPVALGIMTAGASYLLDTRRHKGTRPVLENEDYPKYPSYQGTRLNFEQPKSETN